MKKDYLERVKEVVKTNKLFSLKEDDLWEILDKSKAVIFDGHFELLSKKHSDMFFRFATISQYPSFLAKISKELIKCLKDSENLSNIDVVLGPTSQGMFFAYDIARELTDITDNKTTRAVYSLIDKDNGRPIEELAKGFRIEPNENVLIVNDMTSTGGGIETLIRLTEKAGAKVIGICVFANRGINEKKVKKIKNNYDFHSVIDLNMPSWPKTECKNKCDSNKKLIKSKDIHHLPIYSVENAYERYAQKIPLRIVA